MNPDEQKLFAIAERFRICARTKGIDLSNPAHAFTVWTDYPGMDRAEYQGSRKTSDEAWMLAHEIESPKRAMSTSHYGHSKLLKSRRFE
jgi:hypothetical protein